MAFSLTSLAQVHPQKSAISWWVYTRSRVESKFLSTRGKHNMGTPTPYEASDAGRRPAPMAPSVVLSCDNTDDCVTAGPSPAVPCLPADSYSVDFTNRELSCCPPQSGQHIIATTSGDVKTQTPTPASLKTSVNRVSRSVVQQEASENRLHYLGLRPQLHEFVRISRIFFPSYLRK